MTKITVIKCPVCLQDPEFQPLCYTCGQSGQIVCLSKKPPVDLRWSALVALCVVGIAIWVVILLAQGKL